MNHQYISQVSQCPKSIWIGFNWGCFLNHQNPIFKIQFRIPIKVPLNSPIKSPIQVPLNPTIRKVYKLSTESWPIPSKIYVSLTHCGKVPTCAAGPGTSATSCTSKGQIKVQGIQGHQYETKAKTIWWMIMYIIYII